MKKILAILFVLQLFFSSYSYSAPISLTTPDIYDNAGGGVVYGQTFIAEADNVLGIKWYITDTDSPGDSSVNSLDGAADLVLYRIEAGNPIEIGRSEHQGSSGHTTGLTTFLFDSPVLTSISTSYFIGLDTQDYFGLGIGNQHSSTYEGGYEARISNGVLEFAGGGGLPVDARFRDTSFAVITNASVVPIPAAAWLFASALLGLGMVKRKKA